MKETLRRRAPRLFVALRAIKDQALVESRVLRHLSASALLGALLPRRSEWHRLLPLQRARHVRVDEPSLHAGEPLPELLSRLGVAFDEGGHTIYLSPDAWRASPLASLADDYPTDAGVKLMRNNGRLGDVGYVHGPYHSRLQQRVNHEIAHLVLVANLLHARGAGPRIYDLIELRFAERDWVGYVVRHVGGSDVTNEQNTELVARLRQIVADGELSVTAPGGFAHADFVYPASMANARVDDDGISRFFDFQNFALTRYRRTLTRLAREAAATSHFGQRSLIRGGTYLYQSIPGVPLPAKRNVSSRFAVLDPMLARAGISLHERVILDVGCNIGMMIGRYLERGARWCHGWDLPRIIAHSERVLLGIGCTRFSLTGCQLTPERALMDDLPGFIRGRCDGAIVSYLAVRGHIGWLDALRDIPWAHLIYEGHEGEDEAATRAHLGELASRTGSELIELTWYQDGDSDPRALALMHRRA